MNKILKYITKNKLEILIILLWISFIYKIIIDNKNSKNEIRIIKEGYKTGYIEAVFENNIKRIKFNNKDSLKLFLDAKGDSFIKRFSK